MTTITERVAAGAAWLDANRPGWVDRINLETLELSSCGQCMLGQEFGSFYKAPDAANGVAAADLGFDRYPGIVSAGEAVRQYAELTDAWRDLITARRAAA